ncbi:MAG: c-type cytochrome domain-containing protein [Planctomycetaceae bacterium]
MQSRVRFAGLLIVSTSLLTGSLWAAETEAPLPDFTTDVAPILTKYCAGCHNDGDRDGNLSLESFASLIKGTEDGPAVLPGDAAGSRMIRVLSGQKPAMPPEGEPRPTERKLHRLTHWIDSGAKGPAGVEPDRLMLVVPRIESHVDRHPIAALDQSADGSKLAVARYAEVLIYKVPDEGDIAGTKPVLTLHEFPGNVTSVHFVDEGNRLITASGVTGLGGVAAIWDLTTEHWFTSSKGIATFSTMLSFPPMARCSTTCSYDKSIILWDVASGEQVRTLAGHNGPVYDVAFSPDGQYLVSASADDTCKVWRVADGERLDTLGQPLKEQYTCTFSPDGKTIVAGGADNRIRVWKFISKDRPRINPLLHARFAHEGAVLRVEFTTDGRNLVSVAEDRTIKVWDTTEFTERQLWEDQPDVANALAVGPDGNTFRVGRLDGSIEQFPIDASPHAAETVAASTVSLAQPIPMPTEISELTEVEPNDSPSAAMDVDAPVRIQGVLHHESSDAATAEADQKGEKETVDFDMFRFSARAGQEWVIEVDASRSGSPVDSFVEVLTSDGQRIERCVLQAVRDSYFTFRGRTPTRRATSGSSTGRRCISMITSTRTVR